MRRDSENGRECAIRATPMFGTATIVCEQVTRHRTTDRQSEFWRWLSGYPQFLPCDLVQFGRN